MTTITTRHSLAFEQVGTISRDEKGCLTFEAKSTTSEYLQSPWIEYAAGDSVNKHLLYRHRHPQNKEHADEPYYGRVIACNVVQEDDKKFLVSKYLVKNTTPRQVELQELIVRRQKENRPMGISMQYDLYKNEAGDVIDLDVVEHSTTWKPQVKEALIMEESIMSEVIEPEKTQDKKPAARKKTPKEKTPEEITDEIQAALDNKEIVELEEKIKQKSEELDRVKKEYESRFADLGKKVEEFGKKVVALEEQNVELKKAPILKEIYALEKDQWLVDNVYKTLTAEKLEERLVAVKAVPRPVRVETAIETAAKEVVVKEEHVASKLSNAFSAEELKQMGLVK